MNREELNWLLQTVNDAASAERFVLAHYERGRISFQLMADIARKRGWINRTANQFAPTKDTRSASADQDLSARRSILCTS